MSIFNTKQSNQVAENVTEEVEVTEPAYEGFVDESLTGLQEFVAESMTDMYQLEATLYISDVLAEQAVAEGTAEPESVLEGFAENTWNKIQKIFTDLKTKVTAWFNHAITYLKGFFSKGSKFIEQFGAELEAKDAAGFKHTSYVYNIEAGDKAVIDAANHVGDFLDVIGLDMTASDPQAHADAAKSGSGLDAKAEKEKLLSKLGGDSVSAVMEAVTKEYRGGKDKKEEIDGFSGNSKAEMIEYVKTGKGIIADVQKGNAEINAQLGKVLKAVAKARSIAASGASEEEKAKITAQAAQRFQVANFAVSISSQLGGVQVKMIKEAISSFESTLKSFLRYKAGKKDEKVAENVEVVTPHETTVNSIFESAAKWL